MSVPKFRKKPVVAVRLTPLTVGDAEAFVGGDAGACSQHKGCLVIATLEGAMHASPGDWIIRGVQGEFYPCEPDIFAAIYEPAGADDHAQPEGDRP